MRRGRKEGNQKAVFVAVYQVKKPVESAYADYDDNTHFFVRAASYKSVLPLHSGGRHNQLLDIKPNSYAESRNGDVVFNNPETLNPYFTNSRSFGPGVGIDKSNDIKDTIIEYHHGGHKTITLVIARACCPAMVEGAVANNLGGSTLPHMSISLMFSDGSVIPVTLDLKVRPVLIVDPFGHVGAKMGLGEDFKVPVALDPDAGYGAGWSLVNFFAAGKWTHNPYIEEQNTMAGRANLYTAENFTDGEDLLGNDKSPLSAKSTWQGYAFPAVSVEYTQPNYNTLNGNPYYLNPYLRNGNENTPGRGVFAAEFIMADTAPQMIHSTTFSSEGPGPATFHGINEETLLSTGYIELFRLFNYERFDGSFVLRDSEANPGVGAVDYTALVDTSGDHRKTWGRRWGSYNLLSAAVKTPLTYRAASDYITNATTGEVNPYGYAQIYPRVEDGNLALRQMYPVNGNPDPLQFLPLCGENTIDQVQPGGGSLFASVIYGAGSGGFGDLTNINVPIHGVTYGFQGINPSQIYGNTGLHAGGTYPILDGKTSFFNQCTELTADAPIVIKARQAILRGHDRGMVDAPITHKLGDYAGICAMNGHGTDIDENDYANTGLTNAARRAALSDGQTEYIPTINSALYYMDGIHDWGQSINDETPTGDSAYPKKFGGATAKEVFDYGVQKPIRHGFALSGLEMVMNKLWYGNGAAPSPARAGLTLPPRTAQGLFPNSGSGDPANDARVAVRTIKSANTYFTPNEPGSLISFTDNGTINTTPTFPLAAGQPTFPASFGGADGHVSVGGWQDVMFVITFGNTFDPNYYSPGTQQFNWARHSTPFFPSDVTAVQTNQSYSNSFGLNTIEALGNDSEGEPEDGDNVMYIQSYSLNDNTTTDDGIPYMEGLGNIPGYYAPMLSAVANSYVCTDLTTQTGRNAYSVLNSSFSNFLLVGLFAGPQNSSVRGNLHALNGSADNFYNITGTSTKQCDYTRGSGCMEMYNASIAIEDVGKPGNQLSYTFDNAKVRVRFSMTYKNTCATGTARRDFETNSGSKTATTLAEVLEIWGALKYIPGNVGNEALSDFAIPVNLLEEADVESAEVVEVEGAVDMYELIVILESSADDAGGAFTDVIPDLPYVNKPMSNTLFPYSRHYLTRGDFSLDLDGTVQDITFVGDDGLMSVQLYDNSLETALGTGTTNYLQYISTFIDNSVGSGLFMSGDEDEFRNLDGINPQPTWKYTTNAYDEGLNSYIPYAASKFVIERTSQHDAVTDEIHRVFDFVTYGRFVTSPGCTDPEALNYNPSATINDGSCNYDIDGCTDPTADNYSEDATIDDNSCYNCKNEFGLVGVRAREANYAFRIGRPGSNATNIKNYTQSGGFHWRNNTGQTTNSPQGLSTAAAESIADWQWWGRNLLETGVPLSAQNELGLVAEGNYRLTFASGLNYLTPLGAGSPGDNEFNMDDVTKYKARIYPFSDGVADWLNTNAYNQQGTGQRIIVGPNPSGPGLGGYNTGNDVLYFENLTGAQPVMIFERASGLSYAGGDYVASFDIGGTNTADGYFEETALNTGQIYIAIHHIDPTPDDCPYGDQDQNITGAGAFQSSNMPVYVSFFMIGACGCTDPSSVSYPQNYPWQLQTLSAFPLAYENQGTDQTCGEYVLGPGDSGQLCFKADDEIESCESFWEWCIINSTQTCLPVESLDDPLVYQLGNSFYGPTELVVNLKVEGYWVPQLDLYAYGEDSTYEIKVYIDNQQATEFTQIAGDGQTSADGSVAHQFIITGAQSNVYFELSFTNPEFVQSTLGPTCNLTSAVIDIESEICELISGCTDNTALNFDPNANLDDGSCVFYTCEDLFSVTAGGFDDVIITTTNSDSVCETVTLTALGQEITVPVVSTQNNGRMNVKVTIDTDNTETVQQDRCNIVICPNSAIGATGGPSSQTDLINLVLTNYESFYQDGGVIDLGDAGQIVFSKFQAIDVSDTALGATILSNRNVSNPDDTTADGYDFFEEQGVEFAPGGYFVLVMPEIGDYINNEFFTVQECVNEAIYYLEFIEEATIGLDEPAEPCVEDCADPPCNQEVYGCTDPNNENYNPEATIEDGSCAAPNDCDGNSNDPNCFDCSTAEAVSRVNKAGVRTVDPLIDVDPCDPTTDGEGCTDPNACNYDPFISLSASNNLLCDYCSCTENPEDCCQGEDCGDDDIEDPSPECPDPNNPACDFCCDTGCYDPNDCPPPPDPCVFTGDCTEDPGGGGDDGEDPTIIDPVTSFECEPEFTVNGMTWTDVKNMIMRCHSTEGSRALVKIRNGVEYDEEDLIKLDLITYLFLGGGNSSPLPCLFNCNYTSVVPRKEFSCVEAWAKQGGRRWASTDSYAKNSLVMYPYIQRGKSMIAFFRAIREIEPGAIHPRFKDSGWSLCGSRKLKKTDPLGIADGTESYLTTMFEYFARTCSTCQVEIPTESERGDQDTVQRAVNDPDNVIPRKSSGGNYTGILGPDGEEIIF